MVWRGTCRDSWRNWRNRRNRLVGLDVPAIAQSERADDGKRVSKLVRVAADHVTVPPRRTVSAECAAPNNGASSFRTTAIGILASKGASGPLSAKAWQNVLFCSSGKIFTAIPPAR